jgi:antitoxin (DNA-binding transcriptional repressor) of toxin-antitoxin stability system
MCSKGKSSMQQVKLDEATTQLPSLIDAAVRGEVVLITTDDQQTVQLVPLKHAKHPRRFGSAKGLIQMADDFDAPLDDFREYMA